MHAQKHTRTQVFLHYQILHSAWLVVLLLSAIYRGAAYYRHAFGPKIGKAIEAAVMDKLAAHAKSE